VENKANVALCRQSQTDWLIAPEAQSVFVYRRLVARRLLDFSEILSATDVDLLRFEAKNYFLGKRMNGK
jgi:hypothetical protein